MVAGAEQTTLAALPDWGALLEIQARSDAGLVLTLAEQAGPTGGSLRWIARLAQPAAPQASQVRVTNRVARALVVARATYARLELSFTDAGWTQLAIEAHLAAEAAARSRARAATWLVQPRWGHAHGRRRTVRAQAQRAG